MTSILASGNGVLVDSYDSLLGPYNAATAGTNGDVAALLNGTVDLGNHTIDGNLAMSSDTTLASSRGQIKGRVITNWVMELPDVTLPTTDANGNPLPGMWPSAPGDPTSHTFQNSGYYTLRDRGNLTVAAGVTVTLDVKVSSFSLSASAITINGGTTNAGTLIIYQESGSVSLGGSASGGAVNNRPINFQYFGLPGVTSITMGGDSKFTGVIYAPEADMTLNGGGSSPDLMGSFIVHSWTDKGHYIVHYDTSLAGYYYGYFVVDSWQELSPAAN
jgi:hypothetical protein